MCAHSQIHNQCVLLKLLERSRECGLKLYSDQQDTYNKITDVHSFYPKVIHASYLHPRVIHASYLHSPPDSYLEGNPEIQLYFDGTVTASTPTALPVHTLIDTACH